VIFHPIVQHAPTAKATLALLKRESPHNANTRTILARIEREKFRLVVEKVDMSALNGPAMCHVKKTVAVAITVAISESTASVKGLEGKKRDKGLYNVPS
jgi:hypothetical protein